MLRLKEKYEKEVLPRKKELFGTDNQMAVPRIEKVVLNTGFGKEAVAKTGEEQKKIHDSVVGDLSSICGQKAVLTRAKKSIASFKIRKGMPIGAKVTLRGGKMYDFLDRLIHIVLPRTRDFRGIDPAFLDQKGNLSLGIREQVTFPEISPEKTKRIFGLEITVVTNSKDREKSLKLFEALGFPFKK